MVVWVMSAFGFTYLALFIWPIFLKQGAMQFPHYIPAYDVSGWDFRAILGFTESWLYGSGTPYVNFNIYPPLEAAFFVPFLWVDFHVAYFILTMLTLAGFAWGSIFLPLSLLKDSRLTNVHLLFILTGLFSYGLQFELERGQFNVIAMALCWLAIWMYHKHNHHQAWAYVFLTLAVQLKVYPLIFVIMLAEDWRTHWRTNLVKMFWFGLANFVALFVLGPKIFWEFVQSTVSRVVEVNPSGTNMSVQAFFSRFAMIYPDLLPPALAAFLPSAFLALYLACIALLFVRMPMKGYATAINPYSFMALTIGAMLIPTISWDYKLAILTPPVVLFLAELEQRRQAGDPIKQQLILIASTLLFSAAYFWLVFPARLKPELFLFKTSFIPLALMLIVVFALALSARAGKKSPDSLPSSAP